MEEFLTTSEFFEDVNTEGSIESIVNTTSTIITGIKKGQMKVFEGYDNALTVYTVADILGYGGSGALTVAEAISAIGDLKNKEDYYPASLQKYIGTLEKYLSGLEGYQETVTAYRKIKGVVETAVTIGGIAWNFSNVAKLTQIALQTLQKVALEAAREIAESSWKALLAIPVFAIYDKSGEANKEFTEMQDYLDELADSLIVDLCSELSSLNNYYDIIRTTNDYIISSDVDNIGIKPITLKTFSSADFLCSMTNNKILSYEDGTITIYDTNGETTLDVDNITSISCDFDNDKFYYSVGRNVYELKDGKASLYHSYSTDINELSYFSNKLVALLDGGDLYLEEDKISTVEVYKFHCYADNIMVLRKEGNISYFYEYSGDSFDDLFSIELDITDFASLSGKIYCVVGTGDDSYVKELDKDFSFTDIEFYDDSVNISMVNSNLNVLADSSTLYKYSIKGEPVTETTVDLSSYTTEEEILSLIESDDNTTISYSNKGEYIVVDKIATSIAGISGVIKEGDFYVATTGSNLAFFKENSSSDIYRKVGYYSDNEINRISDFLETSDGTYEYVFDNLTLSGIERDTNGTFVVSNYYIFYYKGSVANNITAEEIEVTDLSYFPTYSNNYNPEGFEEDMTALYCDDFKISSKQITCIKKIDGNVYVGLYKAGHTNNGLYKLSYNNGIKLELIKSSGTSKIFSFAIANGYWYLLTLNGILKNGVTEVEGISYKENEVFIDIFNSGSTDTTISVFTNQRIKRGKENRNASNIKSFVKLTDGSNYKIASSKNAVVIADGNYLYLNNKEDINNRYFYQVLDDYSNTLDLICDKDYIMYAKDLELKVPVNKSSNVKFGKYHNGYNTSGISTSRSGVASYFYISKALANNRVSTTRSFLLNSLKEDFEDEFVRLTTNIIPAVSDFLYNKIEKELIRDLNEISTDEDGALLNYLKKSILAAKKTDIAAKIESAFVNLKTDADTRETFVTALLIKLQTSNDLVKSFYEVYQDFFNSAINTVTDNYLSYILSDYLVTYFQDHKDEWAEEMKELVNADFVEESFIRENLESNDLITAVNNITEDLNNRLKSAKSSVADIISGKSGIISTEDKSAILEIVNNIDIEPTVDSNLLEWKNSIEDVVNSVYLPKQEELYEDSIDEADMIPIKWSELPDDINRDDFINVLNVILEVIRKEIIERIFFLVMDGSVKCYSCVDATEISAKCLFAVKQKMYTVKKIMYSVYSKRCSGTYEDFTTESVDVSFDTVNILTFILDAQTELYAEYIDKIIDTQIDLSDDEVEV